MSLNFHQEIKDLKEKLNNCQNKLVNFQTSYRKMQDRIDDLHKSNYAEKEYIRLLINSVNEILTKLDSNMHNIDIEDIKKLRNIEALILINNAMNQIKEDIDKKLLELKKMI